MRGGIMNKFIGELEDGSGKLYESEYKQKFILSNDGSKVMLVLDEKNRENILKNIKTSLQRKLEDITLE